MTMISTTKLSFPIITLFLLVFSSYYFDVQFLSNNIALQEHLLNFESETKIESI